MAPPAKTMISTDADDILLETSANATRSQTGRQKQPRRHGVNADETARHDLDGEDALSGRVSNDETSGPDGPRKARDNRANPDVPSKRKAKRGTQALRERSRNSEGGPKAGLAETDPRDERPRIPILARPRLARLARKSIRSKEVIGFVFEDDDNFNNLVLGGSYLQLAKQAASSTSRQARQPEPTVERTGEGSGGQQRSDVPGLDDPAGGVGSDSSRTRGPTDDNNRPSLSVERRAAPTRFHADHERRKSIDEPQQVVNTDGG